jgi:hypothetical protein
MPVSVVFRAIRPRPGICNGGQKRTPEIRHVSYRQTLAFIEKKNSNYEKNSFNSRSHLFIVI